MVDCGNELYAAHAKWWPASLFVANSAAISALSKVVQNVPKS